MLHSGQNTHFYFILNLYLRSPTMARVACAHS